MCWLVVGKQRTGRYAPGCAKLLCLRGTHHAQNPDALMRRPARASGYWFLHKTLPPHLDQARGRAPNPNELASEPLPVACLPRRRNLQSGAAR
ncbi:hypothetical protein PR202_ga25955 [Eleusine coracana subsp. coracana]|uniref:Uncharacterized protein n=1 Tax=Eleusine coracana subsp. coracana TaxID=191504 RepID=A0AAV5DD51_ELECO|nr:hypothetical protein PR202_ga25955 [Eleusine coracana subsp. coracana]